MDNIECQITAVTDMWLHTVEPTKTSLAAAIRTLKAANELYSFLSKNNQPGDTPKSDEWPVHIDAAGDAADTLCLLLTELDRSLKGIEPFYGPATTLAS